ncbi:MAG TPA: sialidase family protein [Rhodanobacteraceae bacterium]|nr:sialidase family protein [Rhodanobacteraceae bacterium]
MKRIVCPFLSLCLLLCFASVPPVAFAQDGMHMAGMSHEPELGASAAFDARGRLWLATVRDGHVLLRHSDDFGKTLSAPVEVNKVAEKIYDEGENRPKIAFGPQGQIYVTWSHPLAGPWTGDVRFARSLDGGKHFSAPITVNHDLAKITHRFDALAVDGRGRVVVAWIDKRDEVRAEAAGKPYLGAAIYYSWSGDGGRTFAPDQLLMEHSCECCRIALAREPDGGIAAFFRGVFGDNIRDHAFAVLPTGGKAAHPERATFDGWQIAACPHQGPGLAIGADGVRHAVWYEASHGPAIWYGQLDPGHPPTHVLKIGGPGAGHADVAAHGRDAWVAWNQVGAKGYRLMLRVSHDGGDTFGAPRAIAESTAAVYSPQLLVHDGRAFVAWNTARGFRLVAIHDATEYAP